VLPGRNPTNTNCGEIGVTSTSTKPGGRLPTSSSRLAQRWSCSPRTTRLIHGCRVHGCGSAILPRRARAGLVAERSPSIAWERPAARDSAAASQARAGCPTDWPDSSLEGASSRQVWPRWRALLTRMDDEMLGLLDAGRRQGLRENHGDLPLSQAATARSQCRATRG
jgi:hypothetical protein